MTEGEEPHRTCACIVIALGCASRLRCWRKHSTNDAQLSATSENMAVERARTLRWSTVLWSVARLGLGEVRPRDSLHLRGYRCHGPAEGVALSRRCHTIGELTVGWEVQLLGMRSSTAVAELLFGTWGQ